MAYPGLTELTGAVWGRGIRAEGPVAGPAGGQPIAAILFLSAEFHLEKVGGGGRRAAADGTAVDLGCQSYGI